MFRYKIFKVQSGPLYIELFIVLMTYINNLDLILQMKNISFHKPLIFIYCFTIIVGLSSYFILILSVSLRVFFCAYFKFLEYQFNYSASHSICF